MKYLSFLLFILTILLVAECIPSSSKSYVKRAVIKAADNYPEAEEAIATLLTSIQNGRESLEKLNTDTLEITNNLQPNFSDEQASKIESEQQNYLENFEDNPDDVTACQDMKNEHQTVSKIFLDKLNASLVEFDKLLCEGTLSTAQLDDLNEQTEELSEKLKNDCVDDTACIETIISDAENLNIAVQQNMEEAVKLVQELLNGLDSERDYLMGQFEKRVRIESNKYVSCLFKRKNLVVFEDLEKSIEEVTVNLDSAISQLHKIYANELKNSETTFLLQHKYVLSNSYNMLQSELQHKEELANFLKINTVDTCKNISIELESDLQQYLKEFEAEVTKVFQIGYSTYDELLIQSQKGRELLEGLSKELNYCNHLETECIEHFQKDNILFITSTNQHIANIMISASNSVNELNKAINMYYDERINTAINDGTSKKNEVVSCIDKEIENNYNNGFITVPNIIVIILVIAFHFIL